jgi:hypothetical protein
MRKSFFNFITALTIIVSSGIVDAQIQKKAQVGFRFLENPVSAEVVGRGTAGLTNTYTSNAIFWNPALLGWIDQSVDASVHYTDGIANINYNAAAGSIRLGDFGVLGFSLLSMDYGTFYTTYAVDRSVDEKGYVETGTFSPYAYALGAAFSQKMNDRFSYGVHVKYAYQDLGKAWVAVNDTIGKRKYDNGAWVLDVGAFYDFLYNGIRFGATLQNISREVKYENEAFPLPFAVSFGLSVTPLTFFSDDQQMKDLTLSVEMRHPRDFGQRIKYGLEYKLFDMFTARAGFQTNADERGLTAGVGVKQEVSGFPVRVDYAYEPFGIFGGVHFISLGVSY